MTKTSHFRTCRWLGRNSLQGWANRKLLIVAIFAPFFSIEGYGRLLQSVRSEVARAKARGPGGHGEASATSLGRSGYPGCFSWTELAR